jgi:eukaryotic-like serine/threonine-protein kinase
MDPNRWQQIQELLRLAFALNPSDRDVFLERAFAGDAELRAEVEPLLASDAVTDSFIEDAIRDGIRSFEKGASPPYGRLKGPYQLEREIGRGGMSRVYQAARADQQYQTKVAVKLVQHGMDSEEILRRFRNERQILASLNHPNIAKLLDGGTDEDGLPYFVMEYIEGRPINQYCDDLKLPIVDRLKLFRTVCSAVEYAHHNLVVHRDLKPSNILVTREGVPKLLDFGIAKLLDPQRTSLPFEPTLTNVRMMTPGYASPEQVQGLHITTASDLYSLGVLLYELLAGHRPYQVSGRLPQEIERIICQEDPEKPSVIISRTEAQDAFSPELISQKRGCQIDQLRRRLAGDIDNILLTALRKEPERRYGSVAQMSEDIQRHLNGLPITARRATFSYRSAKFIRRNKLGVAVGAVLLIMAIAFIVSTARQNARTARERDKAERVAAFLVNLFEGSEPERTKGKPITVREILDDGAKKIGQELGDEPEVRAALMDTLGKVYYKLGQYDKAQPMLEEALALRQRAFSGKHLNVATSLNNLADVLQMKGEYERAEPLYRAALEMRRELFRQDHPELAKSINGLADLLHDKGSYDDAEPLYREALAMRLRLFGEEHLDVAESLNNLALLFHDKADYDQAEPLYRQSLEIRQRWLGGEHPLIAQSLNNLGSLLRARGDIQTAEAMLREALAMNRRMLGNQHKDVIGDMNNLATLLQDKGSYSEAESLLREVLTNTRKQFGDENVDMATSLYNLARLYRLKGDDRLAESFYRQSIEAYRKSLPSDHAYLAYPLVGLGAMLLARGDCRTAEPLLREGLEIRAKALSEEHWRTAEAGSYLASCLTEKHRFDEADSLVSKSLPVLRKQLGDNHQRTIDALRRAIKLYEAWGKSDEAARYRSMLPRTDQVTSSQGSGATPR